MLLFLFYYAYQHVEALMGAFLSTFVVKGLGWSVRQGAVMTSVFFGAQAAGRALGVPVAFVLSPRTVLWVDLILLFVSELLLLFAAGGEQLLGDAGLVIAVALAGVAHSTIFGSLMLYAAEHVPLTGLAASVCLVGSSTGKMAGYALTGYAFERLGHMYFVYIVVTASGIITLLFGVMNCYVTYVIRTSRQRLTVVDEVVGGTTEL